MELLATSEYVFVGEGNAHAVVRNGDNVLKLKKRKESFDHEIKYISGVVDPLLSESYRSLGARRLIALTQDFVDSLNEAIWAQRPASRRAFTAIDASNQYAVEEDDATRMIRWFPSNHNLAVEIKVKCGLKCSSPFYYNYCNNNDRLFKLKFSRYELKQMYKTISSSETFVPRSNAYNPCDLCSMDRDRIAKSLMDLYYCPQNNFKITSSTHGVLHDGIGSKGKELIDRLNEYFGSSQVTEGFIPVVSNVLASESVLAEVQQLQGLDVLDVEGVSLVYTKLLTALGTQSAVLETIHAYAPSTADIASLMSTGCTATSSSHVQLFMGLKALQVASGESEKTIASRYQQALQLLDSASVDDCLFLLHTYLLALTMRDASIIIAFTVNERQDAPDLPDLCNVRSTQSHCGVGAVTIRASHRTTELNYRITLCDIGPKPVKKLINKQDEEEDMCKLVYNSVAL